MMDESSGSPLSEPASPFSEPGSPLSQPAGIHSQPASPLLQPEIFKQLRHPEVTTCFVNACL